VKSGQVPPTKVLLIQWKDTPMNWLHWNFTINCSRSSLTINIIASIHLLPRVTQELHYHVLKILNL